MEKLLLFHLSDDDGKKTERIAARLKISFACVAGSDYHQTLEALAAGRKNPLAAPYTGPVPEESLLLMCGFSERRMDKLLFELRKEGVSVDFKAVLTPTNRTWTVTQLLLEMHREKAAYLRG